MARETDRDRARAYRTNVREVGGRAADGMDRESARRTRGRGSNAPEVIKGRVNGNAVQRRK